MTHTHLAFVFPGQGSQSAGMRAELAAGHPLVRRIFSAVRARCWPD
jgi:[acyl-carrier-protein] S-malonyltransferase